ncbi:MAG: TIGR02530 family flagellar biosynthesis protein [Clostridia bacterium]
MNDVNKVFNSRMITTGKSVFPLKPADVQKREVGKTNFEEALREKLANREELKFSKHAEARLKSRNICINAEQKQKINDAVAKAEQKGVKESLILMDNLAFVVSVKNKTVITAVNNDEFNENVFTNIDGAVII